jgi:hypothetical protein
MVTWALSILGVVLLLLGALSVLAAMRCSQLTRLLELQDPAHRDLVAAQDRAEERKLRRAA